MARYPEPIQVQGLRQFKHAMTQFDAGFPRMIKKALNESGEVIRDKTRPWVPRRSGRAAGSLKLTSTQNLARVTHGGPRAPWVPWLDFGGVLRPTGRRYNTQTRERVPGGRYMWRTLGMHREEIEQALTDALVQTAERAGLAVTRGE